MANSPSGDSATDRLVRVLETFRTDRTVQTASEIGRRAGLPVSTAHRIVDALIAAGLLERDDDHRVRLGMRLWELALRGSVALRLRQAALPFMERVQARLREHTQLAVLEQDSALFLERLSHPDAGANITRVAGRLPLHASSSGLVLLAYAPADLRDRVLGRDAGRGTRTRDAGRGHRTRFPMNENHARLPEAMGTMDAASALVEGDDMTTSTRTRVAIIGAGPAGLLLSHLLDLAGIESVVIDSRSREEIEKTIRAGILEQGTVEVLTESGASTRVLTDGHRHDGIELHFAGAGHRIDFADLVGRGVWLYPQHEVLRDLIATRLAAGQDLRFGVTAERVADEASDRPRVIATDADGVTFEIEADFVVGADGSRSVARAAVTGASTGGYFREYPFAWFGILCEAPPSADELIYSNSPDGFALISQRSATVQRMYFQCEPDADPNAYSEAQLWDELHKRVPGTTLREGRIFQRDVLRFRSFVAHELLRGRVALIGDAAHTVPPTGAKGMNLAIADVVILADALQALLRDGDSRLVEAFPETALQRIWKAQHFSWWMTSMLHAVPDASDFDRRRQLGELRSVVQSRAGATYLAEAYTGWPLAGR